MSTPTRHQLPGSREVFETTVKRGNDTLMRHLSGAQWAGEWTPSFARTSYDNSALRAYLNPNDPAIVSDLEICACTAAAAHLAAITPGNQPIDVPAPGGRTVKVIRNVRPKQLMPPIQWRAGVLAAVVSRCHPALEALTKLTPEQLRAVTVGSPPPWFETEAGALAALFQQAVDASGLLRTAAVTVDSDQVDEQSKSWVLDIVVPEMELGVCALSKDRDGFDAGFRSALEHHHHYYSTDGNGHFHGQLAIAPLAMACFAHDLGVTTWVTSDYTPRWIIERSDGFPKR
jgi:hypothetical protein